MEPGCKRDAKPDTSRVAAGNESAQFVHRTSRRNGCIDPWQLHSAGRRCSTRRALHLGSATLLVNRKRPTLVSGAACHRDIRCVRRHGGHAIQGNRERRSGSRCLSTRRSRDSFQPMVGTSWKPGETVATLGGGRLSCPKTRRTAIRRNKSADGVRRGKDIPPRKVGYPMLPERCSWRIGEARLQGFTPLENPYPSRCGLDSVRADALLGFRLLRDFSPGPARTPSRPQPPRASLHS
jgi:hypothetical protein